MVLVNTAPDRPTSPAPRQLRRTNADAHMVRENCEAAHNDTAALRLRQMADYDLYRLAPFTWRQIIAEKIPAKTATLTSNEPRTLADTVASILVDAPVTFRCPTSNELEDIREAGRAVEELFDGFMKLSEKDRPLLVQPSIKEQLVFYMLIRGFAIGLHLLMKNDVGDTVPHLEVWDPLNVYWGVSSDGRGTGQDQNGLAWACHYQDLDAWRLDSRFHDDRAAISGGLTPTYMRGDKPIFRVFDYYDREYNIVVVDDKVVSKTRHFGMGYVPVSVIPVGPSPLVVDSESATAYTEDFGASIYAHNRDLYPKLNAVLSTKYERVLRYLNPAVATRSRTGRYTLPSNISNPFDRGSRFQQSTANEEMIEALQEPALPRDAAEFEGSLQIQMQKGGVPNVVHGQSTTPSSGYNTSLLLSSQKHILNPRLIAITHWYTNCEEHLRRQFSSGLFEAVRLAGEIDSRRPYNRLIEPSVIRQAPAPIVRCRIKNPAELAERLNLAQALKSLGLGDDLLILDEVLEFDDPDGILDRMALQTAKRALPQTQLFEAVKAAEAAGEEELAKLLYLELLRYVQQGQQGPQPVSGPPGTQAPTSAGGSRTQAGGSPQAGQPNQSDESQLTGRPRPEGVR